MTKSSIIKSISGPRVSRPGKTIPMLSERGNIRRTVSTIPVGSQKRLKMRWKADADVASKGPRPPASKIR